MDDTDRQNLTEIVRLLIDAGADVNYTLPEQQLPSRSASGISALLMAVEKENGEIVRMLLSAGANVNYVLPKQGFHSRSATGTSALLIAVKKGNEEIIRSLIESGSDVKKEHSGVVKLLQEAGAER